MEELPLNEAHVMAAIEIVGEATALASGRHPEWVKRRMRDAVKFLTDPANDADTPLRREYVDLMIPVWAMAAETSKHDINDWYH